MKIILAPDSFKGSFSSLEVINHLAAIAPKYFSPLEIVKLPIADGGEGTLEALLIAAGGEAKEVEVTGPLGDKIRAKYGIIHGKIAVIEMAQASGLTLLPKERRNPLLTTTYGTGELIKAALDEGIREFMIGIGGSATNDGGIGAAQALGVSFLDINGKEVGWGGKELANITTIERKSIHPALRQSKITVICDVNNLLTGSSGATMVYGQQKGADMEMQKVLEEGMQHYAGIVKQQIGIDLDKIPGAGAAGGLGAALVAFCRAELKPGIETILDIIGFDDLLTGADLVITGEGRIDGQSVFGKTPVGIAKRCKKKDIRVVALVGGMGKEAEKIYDYGIDSIMTTINAPISQDEIFQNAEELLKNAAERMFRFIKVGMELGKNK